MGITPKLNTITPKLNTDSEPCAIKQRKAGILIPQCPPHNTIEIDGSADYYLWANFSRETYKATYDLLFPEDC